jgi:1,4-alpha-glucan branching enzyme
LRVDAVASMLYLDYSRQPGEWVPNEKGGRENLDAVAFLKRLNELVHQHFPDVLVSAEESTAWPGVTQPVEKGGLGFDLKWNMGWMNDTLAYVREDPLARKYHQRRLTFSLVYAFSEKFLLPLSHDEVVHGKRSLLEKMPGDAWKKHANLRLLYGYMATHPGRKLLFMGGEIGQEREWDHDRELDWQLLEDPLHAGLQTWVRELNRLVVAEPALHALDFEHHGFEWIDFKDEARSVVSYLRRTHDPNDFLVVVANWTPVPRESYRIGVPIAAIYQQLLNSDAERFGGSGSGVVDEIEFSPEPAQRRSYSLVLTLPPLGIVVLKPKRS